MFLQAIQGIQTPRKGRFSWASLWRLLGVLALGISWLLPNHYLPWYFFYSDALAFAAIFCWLLSAQLEGTASREVPRISLAVAALVAVPWLQWAFRQIGFAGEAWLATLYLAGFAGSLFIGFQWGRRPDARALLTQTVCAGVVGAAVVSAILCVFQWVRREDLLGIFVFNLDESARPFANLAQPNLLATLFVMSIPALGWFYQARSIGTAAFVSGAAFLTAGLCLTQSRAGYVSAAAVCAWWMLKGDTVGDQRLKRWWAPIWLVAIGVFSIGLHALSRLFELPNDRPSGLFASAGRWQMWKQIVRGILESPWVGYGWDHTPAAQMAGAVTYRGDLATGYAHDIALDMLAWLGIPLGTAVCLGAAGWLVSRAWRARGEVPVFAAGIALPVLAHSLFEFPFAYAIFLFPAGVMLGAVEANHAAARTAGVPPRLLLALTIAWAALGVQLAREYVEAEDDFRFLRYEAMRIGHTPAGHSRPKFVILTQMDALLDVGRLKPTPGMAARDIERVRFVTLKYPWAPPAVLYAAVLEANGEPEKAERQMRVIHGMYGDRYFRDAMGRIDEYRAEWRRRGGAPQQ